MGPFIISGAEICSDNITGIQRYIIETIKYIDEYLTKNDTNLDVRLCYPIGKKPRIDQLKTIKSVELPYSGKGWNTKVLRKYVKEENGVFCGMSNNITLVKGSIITIHDLRRIETKEYDSVKSRILFFFTCFLAAKLSRFIVTDSYYQKSKLCSIFHIKDDRVKVFYPGHEHITAINSDDSIFRRYPQIKPFDYYYALGSVAKHKNYKWIYEVAKKNPNRLFVVAGGELKKKWNTSSEDFMAENIVYLGYVSDEENKALLSKCTAFLQPSFYEGFGLPPLEALSNGRPIVVSSATCLPEIYKDLATFINPNCYDFNFDNIYKPEKTAIDVAMSKYSWENTARQWVNLFLNYYNNNGGDGL